MGLKTIGNFIIGPILIKIKELLIKATSTYSHYKHNIRSLTYGRLLNWQVQNHAILISHDSQAQFA
jgi:hypothetical protein